MMKVIAHLTLLVFSSLGHASEPVTFVAQKADFSYSSFRSYYSCDYAEARTKMFLKQLGARDIKVRCSGGLPNWESVFVRATFKSAIEGGSATGAWQSVALKSDEACDFNERIIRELLPKFRTRNVHSRSSCWDSQGRVSFTLSVLK